ncbi:hypothetical protein E2C01_023996 [Portunus trituberculatus]|uniref:Uncharacterized protein n=1 Tax=Portunus trituberculatus TaxID=210409 RepID=A0A5B7EBF6_PORTR|nr:hypothetical protein [Portunus trituberculatus]
MLCCEANAQESKPCEHLVAFNLLSQCFKEYSLMDLNISLGASRCHWSDRSSSTNQLFPSPPLDP